MGTSGTNRNAFILDFNLLEEQNLSIEEFIALLKIATNEPRLVDYVAESLQAKQFIKITEEQEFILRERGKIFMELVSIDKIPTKKVSKREPNSEFEDFIQEYRLLWKGRKAGSMGSRLTCIEKMLRWMEENPTYTKEEILKAAKLYLDGLENYRYLQRADFFIFKQDDNKVESSRLSAFIEEIDDRPVEDWTSSIL